MLKFNQATISDAFDISHERNQELHDIVKEQFEIHGKEPIYILQSCYQIITDEKERLFISYMTGAILQLL